MLTNTNQILSLTNLNQISPTEISFSVKFASNVFYDEYGPLASQEVSFTITNLKTNNRLTTSWKIGPNEKINISDPKSPFYLPSYPNFLPEQFSINDVCIYTVLKAKELLNNPSPFLKTSEIGVRIESIDSQAGELDITVNVTNGYQDSHTPISGINIVNRFILTGFVPANSTNTTYIQADFNNFKVEGCENLIPNALISYPYLQKKVFKPILDSIKNPVVKLTDENCTIGLITSDPKKGTGQVTLTLNSEAWQVNGVPGKGFLEFPTINITGFKKIPEGKEYSVPTLNNSVEVYKSDFFPESMSFEECKKAITPDFIFENAQYFFSNHNLTDKNQITIGEIGKIPGLDWEPGTFGMKINVTLAPGSYYDYETCLLATKPATFTVAIFSFTEYSPTKSSHFNYNPSPLLSSFYSKKDFVSTIDFIKTNFNKSEISFYNENNFLSSLKNIKIPKWTCNENQLNIKINADYFVSSTNNQNYWGEPIVLDISFTAINHNQIKFEVNNNPELTKVLTKKDFQTMLKSIVSGKALTHFLNQTNSFLINDKKTSSNYWSY